MEELAHFSSQVYELTNFSSQVEELKNFSSLEEELTQFSSQVEELTNFSSRSCRSDILAGNRPVKPKANRPTLFSDFLTSIQRSATAHRARRVVARHLRGAGVIGKAREEVVLLGGG